MTDEKEPSKEALAYNDVLFNGWPISEDARRRTALALDAWGEAILRRQTASPGVELCIYEQVCDLHIAARDALAAEKAAHEATRAELSELGDLHDKSRALWVRNIEAEEAAHAATRAELENVRNANADMMETVTSTQARLEATRKELAGWEQSARGARDEVLALREKLTSAEAELESLRNPLDVETVLSQQAMAFAQVLSDPGYRPEFKNPDAEGFKKMLLSLVSAKEAAHGWLLRERAAHDETRKSVVSIRKPLEGELAEDVERVQCAVNDVTAYSPYGHAAAKRSFARIEAALRAKGEPQAAEPSHEQMGCIDCAVGHPCDSQAAEPPEPRPSLLRPAAVAPAVTHPGPGPSWPREPKTREPVPQRATSAATDDEPPEPRPIHPECAIGAHHSTTVCANCSRLFREQEPRPIVVGSIWGNKDTRVLHCIEDVSPWKVRVELDAEWDIRMFLAHHDPVELSLGTRVELAIDGQWRPGRVGQMGEEPGRLEVNLREEFRGELGYWVHVSSLRLADPEPAAPAPELPKRQVPLVIIGPNRTEDEP